MVSQFKALPGQFLAAVVEISIQTAVEYVRVWTQDKIMPYIYPYLKQAKDFREGFRSLLSATIKDVLPAFLKRVLERNLIDNLNALLEELCKAGRKKVEEGQPQAFVQLDTYSWLTAEYNVPAETAERACSLARNLNAPLREKLPEDIQEALKTELMKFLPDKWQQALNKNLAELLFEEFGIPNLAELIQATPKKLLCGELPLAEGGATTWQRCSAAQNPDGTFDETKLTDLEKVACPFIDTFCQKSVLDIFPWLSQKLGALITGILQRECFFVWGKECGISGGPKDCKRCEANEMAFKDKCHTECLGRKISDPDLDCTTGGTYEKDCRAREVEEAKLGCESCNAFFEQSLGFSFLYYPIRCKLKVKWGFSPDEGYFNLPSATCPDIPYPPTNVEPVPEELAEQIEKETSIYQWFWVIFAKLRPEIDAIARRRGLWNEWAVKKTVLRDNEPPMTLRDDIKATLNLDRFPDKPDEVEEAFQVFLSYFLEQRKLYDLLTDVPLGVVKPIDFEGRSILREKGQGEKKNFLAKTIWGVLQAGCQRVRDEFDQNIRPSPRPAPYDQLSSAEVEAYKTAYKICVNLDSTLGVAVGIDKKLVEYTNGYYNMFVLLRDEKQDYWAPEEKPEKLRELLNYMFNKTAVNALYDGGVKLQQTGSSWMLPVCRALKSSPIADELRVKKECCEREGAGAQQTRCVQGADLEALGKYMQNLAVLLGGGPVSKTLGQMILEKWPFLNNEAIINQVFGIICDNVCSGESDPNCHTKCMGLLQKSLAQIFKVEEEIRLFNKVQDELKKTPAELLSLLLQKHDKTLLDLLDLDQETRDILAEPISEYLEDKHFILGRTFIDILGAGLGLDKDLKTALDFYDEEVEPKLKKGLNKIQKIIQDGFDLMIETPEAILAYIAKVTNQQWMDRFRKRLFMNITGGCEVMGYKEWSIKPEHLMEWYVDPLNEGRVSGDLLNAIMEKGFYFLQEKAIVVSTSEASWTVTDPNGNVYFITLEGDELKITFRNPECTPPRVYIKENQECCDLGKSLFCKKAEEGEECLRCRLLGMGQTKNDCVSDEKYIEEEDEATGQTLKKCCRGEPPNIDGECCQTVIDCIVDKISYFLITGLTDALTSGSPANEVAPGLEP